MNLFPFVLEFKIIYSDASYLLVDWTSFNKENQKVLEGTFKVTNDEVFYLYNSSTDENKDETSEWVYSEFYISASQIQDRDVSLTAGLLIVASYQSNDEVLIDVYSQPISFH